MIHHGDLFDVLPTLAESSIDACVTDPPYGLEFMGKEWDKLGGTVAPFNESLNADGAVDYHGKGNAPFGGGGQRVRYGASAKSAQEWHERWALEVFRVLKPGAYLVAFGGTRTFHRMTCAIEDAGFEIRDCLSWLYGQGFPKSLNVGDGRGTAMKPSWEPIILARKPLIGTVAANVLTHNTGALNIDACRLSGDGLHEVTQGGNRSQAFGMKAATYEVPIGRWPANVVLDEDAAVMLDEQSGELHAPISNSNSGVNPDGVMKLGLGPVAKRRGYTEGGGASRFYYVAKPSREERDYGTHGLIERQRDESRKEGHPGGDNPRNRGLQPRGNHHPTVKPVELMRWLVRLVTPLNGTVLDPFTGSGTTGMACRYEQRQFIGVEREADYLAIAERRIAAVAPLFGEMGA